VNTIPQVSTWLLKPAELTLKGGNRKMFEDALKRNLLSGINTAGINAEAKIANGRFYLKSMDDNTETVENILSHLIGISGWAKVSVCEKSIDAVIKACVDEGKKLAASGIKTFKIETRRTDKSFPLDSYEICCRGGNAVAAETGLKVDVQNPGEIIRIEIRDKAYIYSSAKKGLGGLPVNTAGRGLLLLSGGIDSPVAGFMMAARGMGIDAIHFHSYPYTSMEAKQKVIKLAEIVGSYCMGIHLNIICFTSIQMRIKERAPKPWITVLLRMAMMETAEKTALKLKSKCLITGESLSQVASQTIENLSCTESRITLPVLRPLIGMSKESIIRQSQSIGTYNISIQPFEDCCTLFNPSHPVLRGIPSEANALYDKLELEPLIEEALQNCETVKCG
jgi:thiamine biosynthesis protein ThiI